MCQGGAVIPPKLTQKDFCTSSHFNLYDLGCGLSSTPNWARSLIKSGYQRLYVNFSGTVSVPLTVICICLSDSTLILSKNGHVKVENT